MSYKVFFVEDEAVTREGIRDNVNWQASGFEFCGEASDGEMALPLLRTTQPDVLITDIKMPFMDGLQLIKIVHERMPWVKIIILSGHDEFEYAQQAIKLGVADYLLKPITVQTLQNTLQKLTVQLDQERKEREELRKLQEQVEENRATLRERLLFKLIVGAVSPMEAVENGQLLGLNLIAQQYLVAILKIEIGDHTEKHEQSEYQQIQNIIIGLIEKDKDIFVLRRDWGDLVLIFMDKTPESLKERRKVLFEEIRQEVKKAHHKLTVGTGGIKNRIADICQSFVEALTNVQNSPEDPGLNPSLEQAELLKVDKLAVENYLHSGTKEDFDDFFNTYLLPLGETALKSNLIRNYIFVDVILAVAKLVNDLGGDFDKVIPGLNALEIIMSSIKTVEELREQVRRIMVATLTYRDSQPKGQYKNLIRQAKTYMESYYIDPELSLNMVAAWVNLSASHFSVVFSQESGQTFKEFLTEIRIKKAKELLRTTPLRSADIAYQVGYNDPHYFSSVFKKHTGYSPIEFRSQV